MLVCVVSNRIKTTRKLINEQGHTNKAFRDNPVVFEMNRCVVTKFTAEE